MKKIILLLLGRLLISAPATGSGRFLATENNKIISQDGDCKTRHTHNMLPKWTREFSTHKTLEILP